MDAGNEKVELRRKIEQFRDLLREYSQGPLNETLLDYIEEMEQQLRDLGE